MGRRLRKAAFFHHRDTEARRNSTNKTLPRACLLMMVTDGVLILPLSVTDVAQSFVFLCVSNPRQMPTLATGAGRRGDAGGKRRFFTTETQRHGEIRRIMLFRCACLLMVVTEGAFLLLPLSVTDVARSFVFLCVSCLCGEQVFPSFSTGHPSPAQDVHRASALATCANSLQSAHWNESL